MTGNTAFSGTIDSSPTAGSGNAVSSGGTKTYVDSAVSQLNDEIDAITNLIDVQSVNVAYPGSGTDTEKVKSIVTGVYSAITLKRHFTIVNVNDENGNYRGEMVISELSSNYSVGLYLGYYTNLLFRVKNTGGTITVARIAEA
jgi:hypothetical protein